MLGARANHALCFSKQDFPNEISNKMSWRRNFKMKDRRSSYDYLYCLPTHEKWIERTLESVKFSGLLFKELHYHR